MNRHNQTALFYTHKWDMQLGYSSHLIERNVHKQMTTHFGEHFSNTDKSNILLPVGQIETKQSWLKALLLSFSSRQKMKKIQADCVQNKVFPLQNIQHVVERMMQDLKLITDKQNIRSIYQISDEQIAKYCHDIKILAEGRYLQCVDICLLNHDHQHGQRTEHKAYRFEMDTAGGKLTTNRPHSVFISHQDKSKPALRIVLKYNAHYTRDAQIDVQSQLYADWKAAYCDIRHCPLSQDTDRDYSCHGFRIQRKVFC